MRIAIICAMEEELAAILAAMPMTAVQEYRQAGACYTEYNYANLSLISVVSGIGKVNAAITTQILLNKFSVDYVLNIGVAGSLSTALGFGDVVIASDLVQHDVDITAFGAKLGQIARMDTYSFVADEKLNRLLLTGVPLADNKVLSGRVVSGDQFIDDAAKARFLHQEFNALACEMEGAAIAQVCYLNQVPFAVVRSLSDMAGQIGQASYSFNDLKLMAAERAALVTKHLLERLKDA